MQAVADALSLMANIVMAWNTSQMQAVLDRWSKPPPGHSTGTDREDCAHQAGEHQLAGCVFASRLTAMLTKILPSRPNASITGTNG
jgi:hypothetical protein